jgi:hypothetical protein
MTTLTIISVCILGLVNGFYIQSLRSKIKNLEQANYKMTTEITRLKEEHLSDIKKALTCSDNDRNRWYLRIRIGEQIQEDIEKGTWQEEK